VSQDFASGFFQRPRQQILLPLSTTPVANLTPVPMTPAANFANGTAGIVNTSGKFAICVNDTGSK
jgi:hypothetical protein